MNCNAWCIHRVNSAGVYVQMAREVRLRTRVGSARLDACEQSLLYLGQQRASLKAPLPRIVTNEILRDKLFNQSKKGSVQKQLKAYRHTPSISEWPRAVLNWVAEAKPEQVPSMISASSFKCQQVPIKVT
jgi:hypothetical protein